MLTSLIITTYNWPQALSLVLQSVANQTMLPDEVIIADDGSTEETKLMIERFSKKNDIKVIHSWQKDEGFRAAMSRNRAISKSSCDYIILIDGDMILHPKFVEEHLRNSQEGFFLQGSRVLLSKEKSKQIFTNSQLSFSVFDSGLSNRKNALHSNFLSLLLMKKGVFMKGIKTCNMSFYKKNCYTINGFNEEFVGWGREDSEYVVRLINSGIARKNIHFNMIQYHLFHNEEARKSLKKNDHLLNQTIKSQLTWCDNGINRY
jgi:glycosyltransferase involved in cell wall biosynthesis